MLNFSDNVIFIFGNSSIFCKIFSIVDPFWNFLLVGGRTDYQFSETTEVAANLDIETGEDKLATANKSGIEVLLRASNMAVPAALEEIAYVCELFVLVPWEHFIILFIL